MESISIGVGSKRLGLDTDQPTLRRGRQPIPDHTASWYSNIEAVEWETPRPLTVGSRLSFTATFLGRRLSYTYEIRELVPHERLVMSTAEGPFPMETTYSWHDAPDGATTMTLRNRGEPTGFARIAAPILARAMRRAMTADLRRLSEILGRRGRLDASLSADEVRRTWRAIPLATGRPAEKPARAERDHDDL